MGCIVDAIDAGLGACGDALAVNQHGDVAYRIRPVEFLTI
jgi:hypothetical protein